MFAAPASAHTPRWTVDCDSVSVDLTYYSAQGGNTVTLTAGGEEILSEEFGTDFQVEELALPQHSESLEVRLVVDAVDDNGDKHDWDFDETKTSPVCEGQEPSPEPSTSTPTEEPTPTPEPSTSEPVEPSEPAPSQSADVPPVEPADDASPAPTDLAETGSSSSTPLIAGIAAAVVAAGAGLLMMARKRRSTQA